MSPETLEIVLPLTVLGVCCLIGEILVQGHRDRSIEERLQAPKTRRRERRQKSEVRS